jgi:hypothetical protein
MEIDEPTLSELSARASAAKSNAANGIGNGVVVVDAAVLTVLIAVAREALAKST